MDLWLPPKPAIIIPADKGLLKPAWTPLVAPPFFKAAGAGASVFDISWTDATQQTSVTGSPHTFTGRNVGAAASDRNVICIVNTQGAATITGCTIGGVTATTLLAEIVGGSGSTASHTMWFYAALPSGTTADIVVTFSASVQSSIDLYRVVGASSMTPIDSDRLSTITNNYFNTNMTVAVGDWLIACRNYNSSAVRTFTWPSPAYLIENNDAGVNTTNQSRTVASGKANAVGNPASINVSASGTATSGTFTVLSLK